MTGICLGLGAGLGVVLVWLLGSEPPSCTTTSTGVRACMPIYVVPPSLWVYVAFGAAGALAGLLIAIVTVTAHRRMA